MKSRIHPFYIPLIISHLLPLFVFSRQLIRTPPCHRPDPKTLRSDQLTVIISGFSEHRIPVLLSIASSYATSPSISSVMLLWCNPATSPQSLSNLTQNFAVIRSPSPSLNYRFYPWDVIKTRGVVICDDDVDPDPRSVSFAFDIWRSDPDRIVGFFVRSHAYDVVLRKWIYVMEKDKFSIVLTKFMILSYEYLVKYSCDEEYLEARAIVEEMNNCEDILMNFVAAETVRKGPVMVGVEGGGVRDYGDSRNDKEGDGEGVREVGLSSRKAEHRKRRGECITEFHRVLGRMPLRYGYGKVVNGVGEQGLCEKGGRIVLCDHQEEED